VRGEVEEAGELLRELVATCGHSARHTALLALCLALQRDCEGATKVLAGVDRRSPTAHFAQGIVHYYSADLDRAVSNFGECTKEYPEGMEWRARALRMSQHLSQGSRAARLPEGRSQARQAFDAALEEDPSNTVYMARVHLLRAQLLQSCGQLDAAILDCSSSIKVGGGSAGVWRLRGELRLATEDYTGAVGDLELAHRAAPSPASQDQLEEARRKKSLAARRRSTHYQVLGVDRRAPVEVIKKAYRTKAKEFHPDKHANALPEDQARMEAKMKDIAAAHSCLSDPEKREVYDHRLERMLRKGTTDMEDEANWSDEEEDFEFDVNTFFFFMFGGGRTGGRPAFVFRR